MKTLFASLFTLLSFSIGSFVLTSCGGSSSSDSTTNEEHQVNQETHEHMEATATFTCPMHPEITGKEGDKCPKCGMSLEAAKGKENMKDMEMAAMASCPMHPEITGKEGDKCSKCGMALVLEESAE